MHMADALLSPAVGGTMWAATAGTLAYCSRRVRQDPDDRQVPLMGVLAAFVFAAQMINFTIPVTGSSGHLGGGLLLAILLGPHAAFLALASVLTVQALFFADGGLLALGCNIFNLAAIPCFLAYPLIYKPLAGRQPGEARMLVAALVSAVVGLQLGAFGVVLQTVASGLSALPFESFLLLMQPIHLAIGLVEGLVTAAVVVFIWKARPEILDFSPAAHFRRSASLRKVLVGLLTAAAVTGGALSWFASTHPDGLEWSIAGVTGSEEPAAPEGGLHALLADVQEGISFLPDYGFRKAKESEGAPGGTEPWPAVDGETTVAGLVGGALTLAVALLIGLLLKRRSPSGGATAGKVSPR